ncbi:MAG: hypothetical protein J6M18_04345 [Actinomycetaceae bacterium]|nr:hypothetical protein [Actinomycetaceae bacterium]
MKLKKSIKKFFTTMLTTFFILFSLSLFSSPSADAYTGNVDDELMLLKDDVLFSSDIQSYSFSKTKHASGLAVLPAYEERAFSAVAKGSPARCTGRTDYPHKSGDFASVHARVTCNFNVKRLETVTVLTRDRWYGTQIVKSDSSVSTGKYTSGDAHPHYYCKGSGIYTYRAYSQHASLENGRVYRASTSNWQVPGISRFKC